MSPGNLLVFGNIMDAKNGGGVLDSKRRTPHYKSLTLTYRIPYFILNGL